MLFVEHTETVLQELVRVMMLTLATIAKRANLAEPILIAFVWTIYLTLNPLTVNSDKKDNHYYLLVRDKAAFEDAMISAVDYEYLILFLPHYLFFSRTDSRITLDTWPPLAPKLNRIILLRSSYRTIPQNSGFLEALLSWMVYALRLFF